MCSQIGKIVGEVVNGLAFPAIGHHKPFQGGDERTMPICVYVALRGEENGEGQLKLPAPLTVLKALVISVRKHLDLGTKEDEIMDITQEAASLKAYLTLRLLFNRWSLKSNNKVGVGDSGVGWITEGVSLEQKMGQGHVCVLTGGRIT